MSGSDASDLIGKSPDRRKLIAVVYADMVGYSRLMHPLGEIAAARVAGQSGLGYILSTISGHKLERVREVTQGPAWYQLYLMGGREAAEGTIETAVRARR